MKSPSKWTVLALVAIGVFMCTLDTSIVNVSIPAIAAYFHEPVGALVAWVIIAYLVTIAALLLTVGRLSDRLGQKPMWMAGLAVFAVGSAACGAAPSLAALIAARVLQGVGGALLMAVSPAMLTGAFPASERGRALGLNATFVALGVSAGPTLGGAITATASWRWIFLINVPLGVGGLIATALALPGDRTRARTRFDVAGAILLGLSLGALTIALSIGNAAGWGLPVVGLLGAAIVAMVGFVLRERRASAPLLDGALFRDRTFTTSTIALVLSFLAGFAVAFLMPVYLQQLRHFSALHTGLLLTPFPIAIAVVGPISGRLADRIGTRGLAAAGMVVLCAGLVAIARLDARSSIAAIVVAQLVAAIGQGLFQAPNNSALMGAAPKDRQGVAAGMLATGRTTGQALSVAIAGAVFGGLGGAAAGQALAHDPSQAPTFVAGFRAAVLVSAAFAALAAVVSLLRPSGRRSAAG